VAESVRDLCRKGDAYGAPVDVSRLDQVRAFFQSVQSRFGGADILVNNAGSGFFSSVADLSPEEWDRMIGTNLTGVFYCCHEIVPMFRSRGGGDVINISSLAGRNPFAGGAAYNASKFGVNGFSEAMMLDHRNEGVRVCYIMPGSVDTEFGADQARDEGVAPERSAETKQANSWKIAPEDIAAIVVTILTMPRRTTISRVEVRPSIPPKKG
jgi:NADP-dependent 3-hydroxy acid dehydrogenase YdfG